MSITIKYYPADFNREYGSLAIKFPMNASRISSTGGLFNMSYTTEDQAVSNYINLLLTKPGERFMQPTYGIGIQFKLFEFNTPGIRAEIRELISREAGIWLPYIVNRNITVSTGEELDLGDSDIEHAMHITINFSVTENGANRTISIFNTDSISNFMVEVS